MTQDEQIYTLHVMAMCIGITGEASENQALREDIDKMLGRLFKDLFKIDINDMERGDDGQTPFTRMLKESRDRVIAASTSQ